MSVLFISHDLGVVGEIADRVVVMRQGTVREAGPVAQIFESPRDAYTKALLACRPSLTNVPARLTVIDEHIAGQEAGATASTRSASPASAAAAINQRSGAERTTWANAARSLASSSTITTEMPFTRAV